MITPHGRRRARGALLCLALALGSGSAFAQPQLPELQGPVNDFANVIDANSARQIEAISRALLSRTGDVIVVVTVPTVAPYADAKQYAVELFENRGRGIGQRGQDNGLLVLLAVKERRVEIEVGYGLEPFITDGFAGETARLVMAPHFRRGEYGPGLLAGVARIASRIAESRGIELEDVPATEAPREEVPVSGQAIFWAFVVFFLIMRAIAFGLMGPRRRRRSRWGRRNTWSGWHSGVGPFGGGFGGGFGGFGGFGGGGGGFGGFGGGRSGGGGGGASW